MATALGSGDKGERFIFNSKQSRKCKKKKQGRNRKEEVVITRLRIG